MIGPCTHRRHTRTDHEHPTTTSGKVFIKVILMSTNDVLMSTKVVLMSTKHVLMSTKDVLMSAKAVLMSIKVALISTKRVLMSVRDALMSAQEVLMNADPPMPPLQPTPAFRSKHRKAGGTPRLSVG